MNHLFSFIVLLMLNFAILGSLQGANATMTLDELVDKKYLILNGDKFNINTALIFELDNCIEVVQALLNVGFSVNSKCFYERGHFHWLLSEAMLYKNEKVASFLIENGADVNVVDSMGATPLLYALLVQFKHGIELLVKHGADVNSKFDYGITIFQFAIECDDTEILELLIRHGAKIDEKDDHGQRAFDYAVSMRKIRAIKVLIDNGLDIRNEIEALNWSIIRLDKSIVELLINYGTDINAIDQKGDTPLAAAIGTFDPKKSPDSNEYYKTTMREIIELLLQRGVNPNIKSGEYNSVLEMAKLLDEPTSKLLIKYGAK